MTEQPKNNEALRGFLEETKVLSGFRVEKAEGNPYFDIKVTDSLTGIGLFLSAKKNKDVVISDIGGTFKRLDPWLKDILTQNGDIKRDVFIDRIAYAISKGIFGKFVNVGGNGTLSVSVEPSVNAIIGGCFYLIAKIEEINNLNKLFIENPVT
jgi:hypothetical protein